MTVSLADISSRLSGFRDGDILSPYPGRWLEPPLVQDGTVLVARDEDLSRVLVDLDTGVVLLADGSGTVVIGSSVATFVACAREYTGALEHTADLDPDDDAGFERIEAELVRRLRTTDPALPAEDGGFWGVAAEEIGLGVAAVPRGRSSPSAEPVSSTGASAQDASTPTSGEPAVPGSSERPALPGEPVEAAGRAEPERILVALADEDRERLFTPDEWKQLTSLAPVTLVRAPRSLGAAVETLDQIASARGQLPPRPTVLVIADGPPGEATLAVLPTLRLVCVVGEPAASLDRRQAAADGTAGPVGDDPRPQVVFLGSRAPGTAAVEEIRGRMERRFGG